MYRGEGGEGGSTRLGNIPKNTIISASLKESDISYLSPPEIAATPFPGSSFGRKKRALTV